MFYLKKAGIILFSVFYIIVGCGITFNLHYCAGKFKGISLTQQIQSKCCGSNKKSKGCCKDKTHVIKIKDDQQAAAKIVSSQPLQKELFNSEVSVAFKADCPIIDLYSVPDSNAPPFGYSEPIYILNGNFRI